MGSFNYSSHPNRHLSLQITDIIFSSLGLQTIQLLFGWTLFPFRLLINLPFVFGFIINFFRYLLRFISTLTGYGVISLLSDNNMIKTYNSMIKRSTRWPKRLLTHSHKHPNRLSKRSTQSPKRLTAVHFMCFFHLLMRECYLRVY